MSDVRFGPDGLLPAIVRDVRTGEVLTLAYMNEEALRRTSESGQTWFWSRSRQELWNKGATSGNRQRVVALRRDCDSDAVIVDVEPQGPACHSGERSCFENAMPSSNLEIADLVARLRDRRQNLPEKSYSAYLFREGIDKILKKVGEESTEVVIAAKNDSRDNLVAELADLVFHLAVLMVEREVDPSEINRALEERKR